MGLKLTCMVYILIFKSDLGKKYENRKFDQKCSDPLLEGKAILTVHKVELLTKEEDPRTRCWKVMVPFKFKSLMENDELYPEGWRHRKFFGDRRKQPNKQPRLEDPRLREAEQELEKERIAAQNTQQDERNISQEKQPENVQPQQDTGESTLDSSEQGGHPTLSPEPTEQQ